MNKRGWIYLLPLALFVVAGLLTSLRFYFLAIKMPRPNTDIQCRFVPQEKEGDEFRYQIVLKNLGRSSLTHLRIVVADEHKELLQGWLVPRIDQNQIIVLNGKTKEFGKSFHVTVYQGNSVIKTSVEKVTDAIGAW